MTQELYKTDYLCICGAVLHNTCKSAISKHKKTKRHANRMEGLIKEEIPIKTEFKKEKITVTFD